MSIKTIYQSVMIFLGLMLYMIATYADSPFGETLQIYTQFHAVFGKPSWVLILRDVESGQVLPYLFDIRNNENYWVAFSFGHSYQVVASTLTFGTFAVIHNFCQLEDGILLGKSMQIKLKGILSPNPGDTKCYVVKFKGLPFTIVNQN